MRNACLNGDLPELVRELGKKGAGFFAGAKGRKILRFLACIACVTSHKKGMVSYLITKRNVFLNLAPPDELDLDMDHPKLRQSNRRMTPLLISIFAQKEEMCMFLLSLRPEAI